MAYELTGFGKFIKWVAVPLVLGAIGYRFVGPNIGGIGAKVPVVRSVGQQIAQKVGKAQPQPATPAPSGEGPAETPPPVEDGATEFQRLRERGRTAEPPRNRRKPIDRVD